MSAIRIIFGTSLLATGLLLACKPSKDGPAIPNAYGVQGPSFGDQTSGVKTNPVTVSPQAAPALSPIPQASPSPAPAAAPAPVPAAPTVPAPAPVTPAPVVAPAPAPVVTSAVKPRSCAEIKKVNPSSPDGMYMIYPTLPGATQPTAIVASCGMTLDGGGWTMVMNYLHKGGTNPVLKVMTNALPRPGSETLGTDESADATTWGHAGNALLNVLNVTELAFYCRSSDNSRQIHFKTKDADCIKAATTGKGHCRGVKTNFTKLSTAHTAHLPALLDKSDENKGDATLVDNTFGYGIVDYPSEMWNVRGDTNEKSWECDAGTNNNAANTLHRIWVR